MSFFNKIVTDMESIEKEFTGPDYSYHKNIRNPNELGMGSGGSLGTLKRDIAGIIDYVEVLIAGGGPASKTGKPLGNKFFLKTAGHCKDYKSKRIVPRSMYINNVPSSSIPLISNISGMSFPEFRGIVPGILDNVVSINPLKMFSAFMEGSEPLCSEVILETIDENNRSTKQTAFVPISELKDLANDGKIPKSTVTNSMIDALNTTTSKEGFMNFCNSLYFGRDSDISSKTIFKKNVYSKYYLMIISLLFLYITFKMLKK